MRKILAVLLLAMLICIIVGCKAKKEFIEVEKWSHDTTTIVDTLRITETIIVHDSIKVESQVEKNDSSVTNVQWNYTTYDSLGNVTSQMNYNSQTQHGSNTASQSAQTSTSNSEYQKEENSSHTQASGHTGKEYVVKEVERDLYWWQKALMWIGAVSLASFLIFIVLKVRKL